MLKSVVIPFRRGLATSARLLQESAPKAAAPKSAAEPKTAPKASTSGKLTKNETKVDKHLQLLSQYYNQDLLKSIKITESLVEPKPYLQLKLDPKSKSKIAPIDKGDIYRKSDPVWEEPILYPNQGEGRTPYPEIPQVRSPDRPDLKLRLMEPGEEKKKTIIAGGVRTPRKIAEELSDLTGLDFNYLNRLYVRPLVMKRVSLKTSKGNIPNFFVLTIVGDRNGTIGLGIGKSRDGIRTAASKAHWNAIKNLTPIARYENRTILGSMEYKFHACRLTFKSAPVGFGLRVNRNVFEICQAAGIKDLSGKVYRSRNPLMVAQGFVEALTRQRSIEELAANRGKKIVDLRKVYYST
ncbi:MRPS5 [[Candida] subhashii]|uniref:Small ribosomal subunit protein uS5m n=1 Tax=[Candida] subhashii TaxID=561895 RepID=A0A8J5QN55_9ASCO|nr:MRPS5 [[Candida] subhashii]KAG7663581.1 MRPS5 [[Candida] subhashii]